MRKTLLHVFTCCALLVSPASLFAAAPSIPPGKDFWVTPANGKTVFTFPKGDVESLCDLLPVDGWDHQVALKGVPAPGSDYDTVVSRIDDAVFDAAGNASTRIMLQHLAFVSINPHPTPCGELTWQVENFGNQAVTMMRLRQTTPKGGVFSADIAVSVEFKGFHLDGTYLGSLFYNFILPDPANGTPWSFGLNGQFRAGMTETDNCIDVLRKKLALPEYQDPQHQYFISNMIAQGKCERTN